MSIERVWYETNPYLYAAAGAVTALKAVNLLMAASGLILLAAALTIVGLRWIYRHDDARDSARRLDERGFLPLVTEDLFYDGQSTRPRRSPLRKDGRPPVEIGRRRDS